MIPTQERIRAIRDADQQAGKDLQMAPSTWTERRDLLAYIDQLEHAVIQHLAAVSMAAPANAWGLPDGTINLIPGWEPMDPVGCVRLHVRVVG